MLQLPDAPTAIFAASDTQALGVLDAARLLGIRVPEELSVVGFDNTILSTVTNPMLTTIAQPMEQMVKLAFDLLIRDPEQEDTIKQRIVMQPELVIRESTSSLIDEVLE